MPSAVGWGVGVRVEVGVGVREGVSVGLGVTVDVGVGVIVGDGVMVGVFVWVGVAETKAAITRGRWSRSLAGNNPTTIPTPAHMTINPKNAPITEGNRLRFGAEFSEISGAVSFELMVVENTVSARRLSTRLLVQIAVRCVIIGSVCQKIG
jgi:hypothetical protein